MFWQLGMVQAGRSAHAARQAEIAASRSASRATAAKEEVRWLEDRLDRLTLACTALWELIRDRTDLTEEDLYDKAQEIDLRDGEADGEISKTVLNCPKCQRVMSPKHKRCLYCGEDGLESSPFDKSL